MIILNSVRHSESEKNDTDPLSIRQAIDKTMEAFLCKKDENSTLSWLDKSKHNKPLLAAIDHIVNHIDPSTNFKKPTSTKEALQRTEKFEKGMLTFRHYFKDGIQFNFNPDYSQATPSPYYHSLEGQSLYYLDWKLLCPELTLYCYNCRQSGTLLDDCCLEHDRTNWSKSKSLFPIWGHSGLPSMAILMNYKCKKCEMTYTANDGRILASLPSYLRNLYPVDPVYCSGTFHFHRDLSDDLDLLMKTYANASFIGKKLHQKIGIQYT